MGAGLGHWLPKSVWLFLRFRSHHYDYRSFNTTALMLDDLTSVYKVSLSHPFVGLYTVASDAWERR